MFGTGAFRLRAPRPLAGWARGGLAAILQAAKLLPEPVIRENLCATPDIQLLQHEWAKHGTCMGNITPAAYFRRATKLYEGIRYPDMDRLSRRDLTVAGYSRAFADANPGMRPDMIKLNLNRNGWLEEVWLCLDTDFRRARCKPADGSPRGKDRVRIWRGGPPSPRS
jgi:ribonuclease T2